MFLHAAHERLHSGLPTKLKEVDRIRLTSYFAQKSKLRDTEAKMRDEGATLLEAVDFLRARKPKKAIDLLLMRYMALEQSQEDGNWKKATKYELRSNITSTIAGS